MNNIFETDNFLPGDLPDSFRNIAAGLISMRGGL